MTRAQAGGTPARKVTVMTVYYEDEKTQPETLNPNRPKWLIALERKYGVSQPDTNEQISWMAWHALGEPGGDLDKWVELVEEITIEQTGGDENGEGKAP